MSEPPAPEQASLSDPPQGWGELPQADQGAAWDQTVPGSAERMLRQVEADYEHRRRMDRIDVWFRAAGTATAAGGIAGFVWTAKYIVDHGAPAAGAGLLGTGVIAAFGALSVALARRQK